ncbi:Imm49 family immunity protein [Nocardiopsis suaedae]|uniref:Imm49 family immunity protein n=1 Tax=Nocardiopsis suaedae TaxID=3018444 RepID=A0ABT4TLV3_9ACTN|nr:Imm49 family immunity protein [Nocardiopsis suaedae]MDA2805672.1 Imm49 family immunity protein [Nocardiopsis suaedae]
MLLFALLSRDAELFWGLMAARLEEHREKASAASPASLLPLPEIAFAAMAVRSEGWDPPFVSDYLPRRLVVGEEANSRARVGPYGEGKDAGALKALSQGPLRVERPKAFQRPGLDRLLDALDEMCQEDLGPTGVWRPEILPRMRSSALQDTARDEVRRFRYRSFADPQGNDGRQGEALVNASQAAAAAFAIAVSDGESVEVTIGGTTAPMPCVPMTGDISTSTLTFAIECALSAGYRRALDFLLSPTVTEVTPSGFVRESGQRLSISFDSAPVRRGAVLMAPDSTA